jgi:hypothetical protein
MKTMIKNLEKRGLMAKENIGFDQIVSSVTVSHEGTVTVWFK